MRFRRSFSFLSTVLTILLGACTLPATPVAEPTAPLTEPTPSLVPINLAGPEMAVGSTYLYADGSLLVAVPAGMFTMGNGEATGRPENPAHTVNLADYWIYSTEVTNRQYAYCVSMGGCTPPYGPDNPGFGDNLHGNDPVVGVDHSQAAAYCSFVHARLPTEAEWEKTARGPDANIYPWGDAAPSCALLNFADCLGKTTPVTSFPAGRSYYGAFDMAGNVLEWVADWYGANYYLESPADDPRGPEDGRARSVRSSAFNSGKDQIPAFTRSFSSPDTHRNNLGFRCVVDDPAYFAPFCTYPAIYGTDGIGGNSLDGSLEVKCPELALYQNPLCGHFGPYTLVTYSYTIVTNDPDLSVRSHYVLYPPGSCTVVAKLTCDAPGMLSFCSHCKVSLSSPPQCPDGYTFDSTAGACIGQGGPGECLPGSTPGQTDGGSPCCMLDLNAPAPPTTTLSPGFTANLRPRSACPAGTWLLIQFPNLKACIPVPVDEPYCVSEAINLKSCTPGGGEDESCPPPPGGCSNTGEEWNENTCSCYCPAGPGNCG